MSYGHNLIVSKSTLGGPLLARKKFQNENIDNYTLVISESYIKPSNVYYKTSKIISENILIYSNQKSRNIKKQAARSKHREP